MIRNSAARLMLASTLAILPGCVSPREEAVLRAAKSLEGQPRDRAVSAFGLPRRTTIENGFTVSYWPMSEVEQYVGVSNKRIVDKADGNAVLSETMGVKLKEHRHVCYVELTSDRRSIIVKSKLIGNVAGCASIVANLQRGDR